MKWTSYLEFLTWLYSLGDKLPEAAQYLQIIIEGIAGLVGLLVPDEPMMAAAATPSAEEQKLEQKITSALVKHGSAPMRVAVGEGKFGAGAMSAVGAWDGTILRQIFAFLQANPELVAFLLSLLKLK